MEEEKQRELLEQIENISARKEAAQLYGQVFARLAEYQETQLRNLYQQVEQELCKTSIDYTVATILCQSDEVLLWEGNFVPLLSTGMLQPRWGEGAIERIYIRADSAFIEQALEKNNVYAATVQTNYETYHILVTLKKVAEELEQVRTINQLMFLQGIDMPRINDICIEKFYDICFWQVKDRLRPDEKIKNIQVEWDSIEPYIQKDVTLLWNVKEVKLKETGFPTATPLINEVRYDHHVSIPHKQSAYLFRLPEGEPCEVVQKDNFIRIRNLQKEYENWSAYEIMPVSQKQLEKCIVMTNGVKQDIWKGLQNHRAFYTKCELYRHVMEYEMASMFRKIEVQDSGEFLFYPKESENYLNYDVMKYILKDMSELYGGCTLTGRLVEDGE